MLASPATGLEIVLGKSLASVIPALLLTWVFFALFAGGVDALSYSIVGRLLVPNPTWTFAMVVLAPLLSLLGNGLAVTISAQVSDPRLAQQLSGNVQGRLFPPLTLPSALNHNFPEPGLHPHIRLHAQKCIPSHLLAALH